jgi:hypothetical protein
LLAPVVNPPAKKPVRAQEREKAEYAAALIRVGASREARAILRELSPLRTPQVSLYLAFALFTSWEYRDAIPILRQYLDSPLDPYQRVVGNVNLASALVHEGYHAEALNCLQSLEAETERGGWRALYGNTLERLAELSIQKRDWTSAERYLRLAEQAVAHAGGFDAFFVRKWRAILQLYRNPRAAIETLDAFRTEARRRGHWETVRECDAYRAVVCRDRGLLWRVYFGTPFASYRERLLRDFGPHGDPPEGFAWRLEADNGRDTAKSDRRGEDPQAVTLFGRQALKIEQQKYRLLRVLVADFYRPVRVGHLFSEAYPGEKYDLSSSRARIYVGIRELRRWLRARRLPLRVRMARGEYQLTASGRPVALWIPGPRWWDENREPHLAGLRARAGDVEFTAAQAAHWMAIPRRSALEVLRGGLERGWLTRRGAGPQTTYRLLPSQSGKKS